MKNPFYSNQRILILTAIGFFLNLPLFVSVPLLPSAKLYDIFFGTHGVKGQTQLENINSTAVGYQLSQDIIVIDPNSSSQLGFWCVVVMLSKCRRRPTTPFKGIL
jgi:hypothetical protein